MSKSIYNIQKEYVELVDSILENGGETSPEQELALMINKEEIEVKSAQYAFVVKDIEDDLVAIDAEIDRLKSMKKVKQNVIDRLKKVASEAMQMYGIEKISLPSIKISFRKSSSVNIFDEDAIPEEYKVKKEVVTISKTKIGDAIKAGIEVPGANIVHDQNIQFK